MSRPPLPEPPEDHLPRLSDRAADHCENPDGRCQHPDMCDVYGCAAEKARLLSAGSTDRSLPEQQRVFDAICTVWEHAVRTLLPNADALRDELARLQEHCGLKERPKDA